jgi:hypothetical protein
MAGLLIVNDKHLHTLYDGNMEDKFNQSWATPRLVKPRLINFFHAPNFDNIYNVIYAVQKR